MANQLTGDWARKHAARRIAEFITDQRGSETIQFVSFVPLFVVLLLIVVDATVLYLTNSEMWNVARDTARRMAAKQLTSEADAVTYAANHLTMYDHAYAITASYDPNGQMQVVISVPIADAMVFGRYLGSLLTQKMETRATMRAEPDPGAGGGTGGAGA